MDKSFRVTLWFKKGVLDGIEAEQAALAEDDLHPGAVDLLPAEDRYLDDGSVSAADSISFSLRTGHTQCIAPIRVTAADAGSADGIAPLVRDMKRGRRRALGVLGASLAAVGALVLLYAV